MKVLLLAPEQGGPCGVLDYALRLAAALQESGVRVTIAHGERKGRLSVRAVAAQARALRPDIVHVQYPMARYGSSLMPHWLAQLPRCRTVVTLHEFSRAHLLRRIAGLAFSRADALVFTNAFERAAFGHWYPWSRGRGHVIPIGSNIPWLSAREARDRDEVCYFGLIRPEKGLEAFLALARLAADAAPELRFRVLGAIPAGQRAYCAQMRQASGGLPRLIWDLGRGDGEVAQRLAETGFVYLPYPDGASERRGTLLAALGNGAAVITSRGPQTPPGLESVVRFAADPGDALAQLRALRADPTAEANLRRAGRDWVERYGWEAIAAAHRELYARIAGR
ncbi:MAG: glycosyltransferase [Gammaproteobacteria bacterium]|nr:glycosyltransferase [Gammaproteobacteria bacterium]